MIHLDRPASFTNPSAGPRRTNLHAMISGFKAGTTTADGVHTLTSTATTPKAYVGPGPPPETPPYAHRYVNLIFEEPAGFAVPASEAAQIRAGIGFDLAKFTTAAGLKAPIAANYLNVTG
jgi:phosphatidylethanolamine-binding protein